MRKLVLVLDKASCDTQKLFLAPRGCARICEQPKYPQKTVTYTSTFFLSTQKRFCEVPDNNLGIKICLHIQESRFRINLGVVDHRRRVFSTPESKKVPIFAHSRESKNPKKSDIFDFFKLFCPLCRFISTAMTSNH